MFADDTSLLVTGESAEEVIDEAKVTKDSFKNWCSRNKLSLNINKSEIVVFGTKRSKINAPISIDLEDLSVTINQLTKFLGIYIEQNLKWNEHVDILNKRLSSVCYTLHVLKYQVDINVLKLVYYANFQSLMTYGISLWGASNSCYKIFITQKRALRMIFGLRFRGSLKRITF
ncbi:hypothetical protein WA026_015336 [Henosepilachna vigintioctopunctata]|uniref:Reverse transcriptase domain-containing protein n=1 Tax=Henosepilachna vigintioctopunctata TaxID=420089 RepID=A0AAW1UP61_9CUCU